MAGEDSRLRRFVAALTAASRPRWPYALAAGVLVVAGAVAAWGSTRHTDDARPVLGVESPAACATLPLDLDATWNAAARRALVANNPQATTSTAWLADVVDHYASAWPALRLAACVSNLHDPTWSPALLDSAARCLSDRRADLTRAAAVTHKSPGEIVAAAMSIRDPRLCGNFDVMTQGQLRRARQATVAEVKRFSDDARAADAAGDAVRARSLAESALAAADRVGDPLGKAMALEVAGESELRRHDLGPAADHLKAAYFEYRGLGDSFETYRTALMVTQLIAQRGKLDDAESWLGHARAEAERTGATPEKTIAVALVAAQLLAAQNKLEEAIAAIDRTLPRIRNEPDPRYLIDYTSALGNKAVFQGIAGHHAAAAATARQALVVQERIYGTDHPQLLELLQSIGLAQRELGQLDDALATLDRARQIALAHLPAGASIRTSMIIHYSTTLGRKDPQAAIAILTQAGSEAGASLEPATRKRLDDALAGLLKATSHSR